MPALVLAGSGGEPPASASVEVVSVRADGCRPYPTFASGIVLGTGEVLTVAHAVAGERVVTIVTRDGRELAATPVVVDTVDDGALLAVPGLASRDDRVAVADGVAGGATIVTAEGTAAGEIVRAVGVTTQDIYRNGSYSRPGLELRASIAAGDSGGAVVDDRGRLVGMVFAASRQAPDRAWASSVPSLLARLDAPAGSAEAGAPRCSR